MGISRGINNWKLPRYNGGGIKVHQDQVWKVVVVCPARTWSLAKRRVPPFSALVFSHGPLYNPSRQPPHLTSPPLSSPSPPPCVLCKSMRAHAKFVVTPRQMGPSPLSISRPREACPVEWCFIGEASRKRGWGEKQGSLIALITLAVARCRTPQGPLSQTGHARSARPRRCVCTRHAHKARHTHQPATNAPAHEEDYDVTD
ncbi:hypothetical protein BKA62DRAFT_123033 [Auriculariales sp. MPI-PUGE-AT-0066]|nr:hypothetical protein BKA62DRAFT_123033 [Auriculariales sp. MPI-PUGE-AT-0066]